MTANLYWEPLVETGRYLSDDLKFVFRKRYELSSSKTTLDESDLGYLTGIKHSGVKSVQIEVEILIKAIEKYGSIHVWESS